MSYIIMANNNQKKSKYPSSCSTTGALFVVNPGSPLPRRCPATCSRAETRSTRPRRPAASPGTATRSPRRAGPCPRAARPSARASCAASPPCRGTSGEPGHVATILSPDWSRGWVAWSGELWLVESHNTHLWLVSSPDSGPDLATMRLTSRFSAIPETNYHGR